MNQAIEDTEQNIYEQVLKEREAATVKTHKDTYIAALKTRIEYEEPPPGNPNRV